MSDLANEARVQLPRWKCHKEVWAAKITGMQFGPDPVLLLAGGGRIYPSPDVWGRINKMVPDFKVGDESWPGLVGGYYVRYDDGFEMWSPAKAFEDGYSRI